MPGPTPRTPAEIAGDDQIIAASKAAANRIIASDPGPDVDQIDRIETIGRVVADEATSLARQVAGHACADVVSIATAAIAVELAIRSIDRGPR